MVCEVLDIKIDGYNLSDAAKLYAYRLDNTPQSNANRLRPAIIICPGGGYGHLSDRESEPIAMQYTAAGFHAFVLKYHVAPCEYPVALLELAASMKLLREHAKEWMIDEERIVVSGFSAGGHLALSFAVNYEQPWIAKACHTAVDMLRPNGCLLSYPVVTSGEYAHAGSFKNLLGSRYEELKDEMSLEHKITEHTPPMFIWHTFTDSTVPVENSLLLVAALRKMNISTEFHMYPVGIHGLALANEETQMSDGRGYQPECQGWIQLAIRWIRDLGGEQC